MKKNYSITSITIGLIVGYIGFISINIIIFFNLIHKLLYKTIGNGMHMVSKDLTLIVSLILFSFIYIFIVISVLAKLIIDGQIQKED